MPALCASAWSASRRPIPQTPVRSAYSPISCYGSKPMRFICEGHHHFEHNSKDTLRTNRRASSKSGTRALALRVFAATILIGVTVQLAYAQQIAVGPGVQTGQPTPDWQGLEILPTPYLWLPWTSVGVRPANTRFSSRSSTIDAG